MVCTGHRQAEGALANRRIIQPYPLLDSGRDLPGGLKQQTLTGGLPQRHQLKRGGHLILAPRPEETLRRLLHRNVPTHRGQGKHGHQCRL